MEPFVDAPEPCAHPVTAETPKGAIYCTECRVLLAKAPKGSVVPGCDHSEVVQLPDGRRRCQLCGTWLDSHDAVHAAAALQMERAADAARTPDPVSEQVGAAPE